MFVIEILAPALAKFGPKRLRSKEAGFTIVLLDKLKIEDLITYLKQESMTIENLRIRQIVTSGKPATHELEFRLAAVSKKPTSQLYLEITALPYVESVEIEFFS